MTDKQKPQKCRLNSVEICEIIKVCGQSGVAELNFGDFQVCFLPKLEQAQKLIWAAAANHSSGNAPSEAQAKKLSEEALEDEERKLREDQIQELLLTDPVEYERLQELGELEDEKAHGPRAE